jgi:hypothetical protein
MDYAQFVKKLEIPALRRAAPLARRGVPLLDAVLLEHRDPGRLGRAPQTSQVLGALSVSWVMATWSWLGGSAVIQTR